MDFVLILLTWGPNLVLERCMRTLNTGKKKVGHCHCRLRAGVSQDWASYKLVAPALHKAMHCAWSESSSQGALLRYLHKRQGPGEQGDGHQQLHSKPVYANKAKGLSTLAHHLSLCDSLWIVQPRFKAIMCPQSTPCAKCQASAFEA